MKTDGVVIPQDVLRSPAEVKRRGNHAMVEELERLEPDLSEYLIEELSGLHHLLLDAGLGSKRVRRVSRRMEALVLVAVDALRRGQRRLWDQFAKGEDRLAALDPPPAEQSEGQPPDGEADD